MKRFFIFQGKLTSIGILFFVGFGFLLTYLSIEFIPYKIGKIIGMCLGLGLAALGGFSGRAKALGLAPPFTNDPLGWRAAKKSYEEQSEPNQNDSKTL